MIPREKTIKSEKIFEGKMINLRVDTVELPGQRHATREIVEHPGAVCIVPITSNGKIIMVKQFRKPVEDILLEIPAGKLDKEEDPLFCARRELKEETGYEARDMKLLFDFHTSPGFSNERLHLYIARDLVPGEATPDEDEYLEIEEYTLDELVRMIYEGKIKDCKTIVAIMSTKDFMSSL